MSESKQNKKLLELEQKIEELTNSWKRALADYTNLEKRVAVERDDTRFYTTAGVLNKILPALDNLKKAAITLEDQGLQLIVKQFNDNLGSLGVVEYGNVGDTFDPSLHEAVAVDEGEGEKKVITDVFVCGYKLGERVIRPASVKVGSAG